MHENPLEQEISAAEPAAVIRPRRYRYSILAGGIGILAIVGVALVHSRANLADTDTGISAWGGGGVLGDAGAPLPADTLHTTSGNSVVASSSTLPYTMPSEIASSNGTIQTQSGDSDAEYNAILAQLSHPQHAATTTPDTNSGALVNAYAFIPSGILSIPKNTDTKTPAQAALYAYGNAVGAYIRGYEGTHTDTAQILTDSVKDRSNTQKAAAVEGIGKDLIALAANLRQVGNVPDTATADNAALAAGYQRIGERLVAVAHATAGHDSDFIDAIKAYDTAANGFMQAYINTALLFSAYAVQFSSSDPGNVFSFTPRSL